LPHIALYSRFAEFPRGWIHEFAADLDQQVQVPVAIDLVGDPGAHAGDLGNYRYVHVTFHGYVPRFRIPSILGRADVAVYPYQDSLVTRSKQSVKLLELMAAGCSVIVSDVGEAPITIGDSGVVIEGVEPSAFAHAARELIGDPNRTQRKSRLAMQRVADHFSISQLSSRLVDAYERIGVGVA
ncbi:MAG: glycosyltransferase family 4 protein, partial [Chloroflexota bacterium]